MADKERDIAQPRRCTLPMYDLPELRQAIDALWGSIRRNFDAELPGHIDRQCELWEAWGDDCLLSQTCGYPFTQGVHAGRLQYLATPVYKFCTDRSVSPGDYCSLLIVPESSVVERMEDLHLLQSTARVAVNSTDSHSGYNTLRATLSELLPEHSFFGAEVLHTGSHAASLGLVQEEEADLAAIDCVTFGLLKQWRPQAVAGVRVIGQSGASPALPFVSGPQCSAELVAKLQQSLQSAMSDETIRDSLDKLGIEGLVVHPRDHYRKRIGALYAAKEPSNGPGELQSTYQLFIASRRCRVIVNRPFRQVKETATRLADGKLGFVGFLGVASKACPESVTERVWALDDLLVAELLHHPQIIAYCSAERTPQGEWGNIVLLDDLGSTAVDNWKHTAVHTEALTSLAPHYYSSVRLHRGHCGGREGWRLKQSIFLDYTVRDGSATAAHRMVIPWTDVDMDPLNNCKIAKVSQPKL